MLSIFGTAGALKSTGSAEPTVSSSDLPVPPFSGVTWITAKSYGAPWPPVAAPWSIHWSEVCAQSPHHTPYGAISSLVAFSSSAVDLAAVVVRRHEGDVAVPAAVLAGVHAVARRPHHVGLAGVGRVLRPRSRSRPSSPRGRRRGPCPPRARWRGTEPSRPAPRPARASGRSRPGRPRCRCRRASPAAPRRRASGPGPRGPR